MKTLVGVVLANAICVSAQVVVDGPTTGLIYDRAARSLRYVVGVPGSAIVGPAVSQELTAAWPAPGGRAAVVDDGESVRAMVPRTETTGMLMSGVSSVAWAADGRQAVAYSSAARSLQRLRVTDTGSITADSPLALTAAIGEVLNLAMHTSGRIAVATHTGIYGVAHDGTPHILSDQVASALAFGAQGHVFGATADAVIVISSAGVTAQIPAGTHPHTLSVIAGRLVVADKVDGQIRIFDESGALQTALQVSDVPDSMPRLNQSALLLVSAFSRQVRVLDLSHHPRIAFIPAIEAISR